MKSNPTRSLPDIAESKLNDGLAPLDQVGMNHIQIPILIQEGTTTIQANARANIFVNITDPRSKGIHMSRLFLQLQEGLVNKELSLKAMHQVLEQCIQSHASMSDSAYLTLNFDLTLKRKALLSDHSGWRTYPISIEVAHQGTKCHSKIHFSVVYSSTCPCSAALARQLIQEKFANDFSQHETVSKANILEWLGLSSSILATPHGQRSEGKISFIPKDPTAAVAFTSFIDQVEKALQTPVQTAVKREDEQEFARLNGSNLMFAEDAVRKIKQAMDKIEMVDGYRVEAHHFESLHAHDAVAKVSKNYPAPY